MKEFSINIQENQISESPKNFTFSNETAKNITFYIFKPNNQTVLVTSGNATKLLNPSYPTKILIQGWSTQFPAAWEPDAAYLYHQIQNNNVLLVDWTAYSLKNYISARSATRSVGYTVGDFIIEVQKSVPDFIKCLHLIGQSLGGQVVGFAGKRVYSVTKTKFARISGLDAAAPLYELPIPLPEDSRLAKSDANFVDLIHTQIPMGLAGAYGHVDFYVNFAIIHPQCLNMTNYMSCGHWKAPEYFVKSIPDPKKYKAVKCDGLVTFLLGLCQNNEKNYMGDGVNRKAQGVFHIFLGKENHYYSVYNTTK